MGDNASRRLPRLVAVGVFLLLLVRPLYIVSLRRGLEAGFPEYWAQLTTNGSPTMLVPALMGSRYHDEALYASRTRQVLVRGVPANPYVRGAHGVPQWFTDCVSHYLLAAPAALFGGNMTLAWPAAGALLGALWFLLFYRVYAWWSGRQDVALPLALFSISFPDLYSWLLDVNLNWRVTLERYAAVFFSHHALVTPYFYRLPSLFLSMFLLCWVFVGAMRLSWETEKRSAWAALLGFGLGLMILVHPFEYAYGFLTFSIFTAALWKLEPSPARRWNVTLAFLASGLVPAAYIAVFFAPQLSSGALDSLTPVPSRHFYLITLVHAAFAGFGISRLRAEPDFRRRAVWLLLVSAQAAGFLVRNAQVVLGFELQVMHYIPMVSFFGTVMAFLVLAEAMSGPRRWDRRLGALATLAVLACVLAREKSAAEATYQLFGLPRDAEAALRWVKERLPAEALVLSLSMSTNETIPLYTDAKVQVQAIGVNHSGPIALEAFTEDAARLLKTCRADVGRFLEERWVMPSAREAARARIALEQTTLARVDLVDVERGEWFYGYYTNNPVTDEVSARAARARFPARVERAAELERPYYIWVDARDAHLYRQSPESFGGRLLYGNPTVKIYGF